MLDAGFAISAFRLFDPDQFYATKLLNIQFFLASAGKSFIADRTINFRGARV